MKLVFKKNDSHQISVLQAVDGHEQEFSYVDMIKSLIESRKMDQPDISDGFTEAEKSSIQSMVTFINREISTTDETSA